MGVPTLTRSHISRLFFLVLSNDDLAKEIAFLDLYSAEAFDGRLSSNDRHAIGHIIRSALN